MGIKAVYVLASLWNFDHFNTEYATLTVEDWDRDILENLREENSSQNACKQLLEVAKAQSGGNSAGDPHLLALFKIIGFDGSSAGKYPIVIEEKGIATTIIMHMKKVCTFDHQTGKPLFEKEFAEEHARKST